MIYVIFYVMLKAPLCVVVRASRCFYGSELGMRVWVGRCVCKGKLDFAFVWRAAFFKSHAYSRPLSFV